MILRLGSLTIVLIGGLWLAAATLASQGVTGIDRVRLLEGAIDVHVHSYPDDRPRSIDAIEVAKLAHARKLRAIVLKNHYDSTAGLAFLVRKVVPGIEVFGGVALNLPVGGINPAAVEHMAAVSGGWGRIVWMPTFDAENQVRTSKESRPFVSVTKNGELLPDVRDVIAVIAKRDLVLATGHSAPSEGLLDVGGRDAGSGPSGRLHRVRRWFAHGGGCRDTDEPVCGRDSPDWTGILHPLLGSRPAR